MNVVNPIPLWISIVQSVWVLIALLGFMWLLRRFHPNRRVATVVRVWIFLTAFAAWRGDLANLDSTVPTLLIFALIQIAAVLYFVYATKTGEAMMRVPQWILIGGQSIRIPIEMLFAKLSAVGLFPLELTYSGLNFDVIVGFLGLVLGVLIFRKGESGLRKAMIAFNIVGLIFLMRIAFHLSGSLPSRFQFLYYPQNTAIITIFPMQWIPLFMMPLALVCHLLSLRKIFSLTPSSPASVEGGHRPAI